MAFQLKFTTIFALLLLVGCGKSDPLTTLDSAIAGKNDSSAVSLSFCTDPAYDQKQYLKTIVILDHSGSNQKNFLLAEDGSGAPKIVNGVPVISSSYATDPNGILRYGTTTSPGTLLNYLANLPANDPTDPTKFFALIDFSASATTYPANSQGFTSDVNAFYNYVANDALAGGTAPADGGSTDYLAALTAAFRIMNADVQSAQSCAALPLGSASPGAWCPTPGKQIASSYVIVFMSDGSPIINTSGIGLDAGGNVVATGGPIGVTYEPSVDILAQVGAMTAMTSNQNFVTSVNLFTVYYYNPANNIDQKGRTLLANMAKAGNGLQYDALSGSTLDYSKFQPPRKRVRYSLTDVFVTNQSAIWWTDNQLHADRDGDGLPDDVEATFGTSPNATDSDGNGVSDLVEYRLAGGVPRASVDFAGGICSAISHQMIAGKVVFKSSDVGGFNDCEKIALDNVSGIGNGDSNGDLLPDWLEFRAGVPFQVGTAPAITTRDQDGFTPYQKIKLSLPLHAPTGQFLDATPADYALRLVSSDNSHDCYSLNVSNLPILSDQDVIRVDILEKSEALRDNGLYRVGRKALGAGRQVHFEDWTNANEIAAGTWKVGT